VQRGANLPLVSGYNESVVLDVIRRSRTQLSRADITTITGLSPQTITNVTRRLIAQGLVVEAGTQIHGRGKPPTILQLVPSSRFTIGVHLDPAVINYVLLDLAGTTVAHTCSADPPSSDPAATIKDMAREIESLLESSGVERDRVVGVGIAVPGPIDAAGGILVSPPLLRSWRDVPVRDSLAELTGMSVLLETDVNAAAVAELWADRDDSGDFAFFYLGSGIGTGLALGRQVHRGPTGNAGDGGTIMVPSAELPAGRKSEMLGHLATPQFLTEYAIDLGLVPQDSSFDTVLARAAEHDPAVLALFQRAAGWIGSAIVTLVNLLDISAVIFGGPFWNSISRYTLPAIVREVEQSPRRSTHRSLRFRSTILGEHVVAIGAASLVLESLYSPRATTLLIRE